MIHKSYTIRFVLHRRSDTARQYLQMRVTPRGGKPVSFATGVSLLPAEWDAMIGRAKGRSPEAAEANTLIAQWSQLVANVFSHYDSLNIVPTAEQLRSAFARATELEVGAVEYVPQPTASPSLIAVFTQFMTSGDKTWSQGTLKALASYRRMLGDFRPDTPINNIDLAWMERFHVWLVDERRQQGVSVHGNLSKMRWFLRWARKKGLYNGTADSDYLPKVKGSGEKSRSIIYLTRSELKRLEEYEYKEQHFKIAKDVFLFCCYTGLRSSDALKLTRADCYDDHITFIAQKTDKAITVPLNDKAKTILEKYAKCSPGRRQKIMGISHPALPTPFLKTLNKHLHKMMEEVGFDTPTHHVYYIGNERHDEIKPKYELISTHTARHTFIVTAISLGIPLAVVKEWTGHSTFEAMKPYIAIANETSAEQMQRFNTL